MTAKGHWSGKSIARISDAVTVFSRSHTVSKTEELEIPETLLVAEEKAVM